MDEYTRQIAQGWYTEFGGILKETKVCFVRTKEINLSYSLLQNQCTLIIFDR
jgi:hypothetical protein